MPEYRQWDIVRVRINPEDRDAHPAVIISSDEIAGRAGYVRLNVLYCSTKRPAKSLASYEVMLNSADGLEALTKVDCGFLYTIKKDSIINPWGRVSVERRRAIKQKIVECFGLL